MEIVADLLRLADRPEYAPIRDRMRAVILRRKGLTLAAIGSRLGRTETWVKRWNDRFKTLGFDGLRGHKKGGSKSRLSKENETLLMQRLEGQSGEVRTIGDVRSLMEREFSLIYSKSGASDLLRRLGFVKLRPRPKHPASDTALQADFKAKTLPLFTKRSAVSTREGVSKSGSKTRPASANKVASRRCGRRVVQGR